LVAIPVDVILAPSSTFVEAARKATSTIPIVFAVHADPVGLGHVASLAQPGGNITGMSMLLTELAAKGLEMMAETVPQVRRIGMTSIGAPPPTSIRSSRASNQPTCPWNKPPNIS
jgi:putative tryptophan/tyrosine transport system substrate-binding protein